LKNEDLRFVDIASGLRLRSTSYDPTGRLRLRPDRSLHLFLRRSKEYLKSSILTVS